MTHLIAGEPAPWFSAPTRRNPKFSFSTVGGRYVLLAFLPSDDEEQRLMVEQIQLHGRMFSDARLAIFTITDNLGVFEQAQECDGQRWFLDDGAVAGLYGLASEQGPRPTWVLIDPAMRILRIYGLPETGRLFADLASLPPVDQHTGAAAHAPVLIVPRILEPAMCKRLIELYEADGGGPSGVMREIDGKTVGVFDNTKKRRDAHITDERLREELVARIRRRLVPEIVKAFNFTPTRIERYIVSRYSAEDGGFFRAHRDNTTAGTAHRQFAVSINLNAEDFEGGDLRFPEFGSRTYRPPTGGAVVFGCGLLHEATPVTRGNRFAFLPFLYDEVARKIRDQNMHLVQAAAS